jgi:hypothetical protein
MYGFLITYKPKDNLTRTMFNHTLFGRLLYRNYRGRKWAYYVQGMLDKTQFDKVAPCKVFVENLDKINKATLDKYVETTIYPVEREDQFLRLHTGREYWERIAREKELPFKERKRILKNGTQ